MTFNHVFDPQALEEYKDATVWYSERSLKAAENFVKEVTGKIGIICKMPFSFKRTYKDFRETSLKKYPYSIVFLIDEEKKVVIIFSLFHHKRNPRKKYRRRTGQ
jgi:plasmid stabilization system protein ParE